MAKTDKNYDWPGEWFRAMKDCGEDIMLVLGQKKENAAQPEWFELPHSDYDGIGALVYLLREQGFKVDKLPTIKADSYTFFRKLRGMLAYLPTSGVWKQQWLKYDATIERPVIPVKDRFSWNIFTEEETKRIITLAKTSDVTVNTYLLYHLDVEISSVLAKPLSNRRWCVPVNIRGAVNRASELQLHNSFLAVDIANGFSIKQLHNKIIAQMKRGYHWGAWAGLEGSSMLGKEGLRKYVTKRKIKGECWTGTFTNLGTWEVPGSGNWLVGPNVPYVYPIGAGCLTMNGCLAITLQLHKALDVDADTKESILNNWKQACLNG